MATLLIRNLSRIGCRQSFTWQRTRYLHTTSLVRKDSEDMEDLQKNPYYSKYADKIAKMQKTSPEDFLDRLGKMEKSRLSSSKSSNEREFSLPTKAKPSLVSDPTSQIREKKLNDIMKVEMLTDKSKDEIASIWTEHFAAKDAVCAVIPASVFKEMKKLYNIHKTFLLPLPRKEGYEFVVVQFSGNEAHFTTLINFQAFHENAPECLNMIHYEELAETKDIVLMVGEFDKNVLSVQEAHCLANQIEMYYCNPSDAKKTVLETFTFKPNEFRHQDLISIMENISLLTEATVAAKSK